MHALIKGLIVATLLGAGFALHHHHGSFFGAQDDKKQDAKSGGMPMPELTPEHRWLAEGVGTFKATGTMYSEQGPMPMDGVQTNTMQGGGYWQLTDYKEKNGSFFGHGVTGWDKTKKKFVSVWIDNMNTQLALGEGTLSADKQTVTMMVDMPAEGGKFMKVTETVTRKDDGSATFEMTRPGPDGKPVKMLEIKYTKM